MVSAAEGKGPRNITALIFHPSSHARRFAPVFNITPRSRMFYLRSSPLSHHVLLPSLRPALRSLLPRRCFSYESRGIAPRNEFTILIWRAALAIYYLHGEKKTRDEVSADGGRRTNDSVRGREGERRRGLGIEGGRLSREARQFARVENISYLYASTAIKQ